MDEQRFNELLDKYIRGTASQEEANEVMHMVDSDAYRENLVDWLDTALRSEAHADDMSGERAQAILQHVLDAGKDKPAALRGKSYRLWPRIAAAAVLLLTLVGAYHFFGDALVGRLAIGRQVRLNADYILPGTNKATLSLADGRRIDLSSDKEGISLKAGELTYTDGTEVESDLNTTYAVLTTPRGGQYQVVLPDGTRVWLNAASSLKYPTSFDGLKERRVELTGEGYFEVTANKALPFRVITDHQEIFVLGTHFNVHAYADESETRTTLLEGSVRVSALDNASSQLLKPGQQAVLKAGELTTKTVETDETIAWKNGYFQFSGEDLGSVLRKVARWYDVEIDYRDEALKQELFTGTVSRYEQVSKVLKTLELTGAVHFSIEGRKIIAHSRASNE